MSEIRLNQGDRVAIFAYEDDGNAWILYGMFSTEKGNPVLKMDRGGEIPMEDEWLKCVRTVNEDVASIIRNADYWLKLTIGTLEDTEGYLPTGFSLPKDDA